MSALEQYDDGIAAGLPLVFDKGPLGHFASAGWLGLLKTITGDRPAFMPDLVRDEILGAVENHPHLRSVLDAEWLQVRPIVELEEIVALSSYTSRLAVGRKNLGECGVLALAKANGWSAVLDDRVARKAGEADGLRVSGTVALLVEGIRSHGLTLRLASSVIEDLLIDDYRLPFQPGDFERWAREEAGLS
jgi:predicted nucleic acid-binding protein